MLTTIHNANDQVAVKRKEKHNGKWVSVDVKQGIEILAILALSFPLVTGLKFHYIIEA